MYIFSFFSLEYCFLMSVSPHPFMTNDSVSSTTTAWKTEPGRHEELEMEEGVLEVGLWGLGRHALCVKGPVGTAAVAWAQSWEWTWCGEKEPGLRIPRTLRGLYLQLAKVRMGTHAEGKGIIVFLKKREPGGILCTGSFHQGSPQTSSLHVPRGTCGQCRPSFRGQ